MAVMLRSLGVPARVVNGFQRGEWNPYGQYYIVRYYDAHSWVEAYLPDTGWVTFDPTPRASVNVLAGRTPGFLYLDSLRLQWHRYVVNWTLRDQIRAVQSVQFRLARLRGWSAGLDPETRTRLGRAGALVIVLAVGAVGVLGGLASPSRRVRLGAEPRPRLLPTRSPGRGATGPPPGHRRDRAGVQRPSLRSRAGGRRRVHARDGALRARAVRRDAAECGGARRGRDLAHRPRAQVTLSLRPRLTLPAPSAESAFATPRIGSVRYAGDEATRSAGRSSIQGACPAAAARGGEWTA